MRKLLGAGLLIFLTANGVVALNGQSSPASTLRSRTLSPTTTFVDLDRESDQDAVVEEPLDPLERATPQLRETLAKRMDPLGVETLTVEEFLETFALRLDLKFKIDDKAFKAAGIDPDSVLKKEINYPKGKRKPGSQVLGEALAQLKCSYVCHGDDTIIVIPARK